MGIQRGPSEHPRQVPGRHRVPIPPELEEVCIGAQVKATCEECGTAYETDTNWAGDWEVEDLPEGKSWTVDITMPGLQSLLPTRASAPTTTLRRHHLLEPVSTADLQMCWIPSAAPETRMQSGASPVHGLSSPG